jgi:diguanylate cyclase (GGDEF)-like protein
VRAIQANWLPHDLDTLRLQASRFFAVALWVQVPVASALAASNHIPAFRVGLMMALAALVATVAAWRLGGSVPGRLIVTAAFTTAPALLVYAGTGPWQADWHMYFFVVFGMLVAYVDWRVIILAGALTAVHHLFLDLVFPSAVFPAEGLGRVALHAAIVTIDCAVLILLIAQIKRLFYSTATSMELAHHDQVTALPNRLLLMERMTKALAVAQRDGSDVIVFYMDLDFFKNVNDTFGHALGDQVLREIGARLLACMRLGDTVSRFGGDEFVLVASSKNGPEEGAQVAARLLKTVAEPITVEGSLVRLGASIGISISPLDGVDAEELIEKADAALYRAKHSGRNRCNLYSAEIQAVIGEAMQLEADLKEAIAQEQFVVYYQPLIDLASKHIVGAEALVRWQHPTRGLIMPDEFISFAEDRGLIIQIENLVLDRACSQIRRFVLAENDPFSIAVNISARHFREPELVKTIAGAVALHGISSGRLDIEITESAVMSDTAAVIATLRNLKALGIRLSLDDFGTGYCSLAYIKRFAIDSVKIDRSFVKDIATDATDREIAKAIVTLAHSLGLQTIAEGVETQGQADVLADLQCDQFQGYLISQPLPEAEFEDYMRRIRHVRVAHIARRKSSAA